MKRSGENKWFTVVPSECFGVTREGYFGYSSRELVKINLDSLLTGAVVWQSLA